MTEGWLIAPLADFPWWVWVAISAFVLIKFRKALRLNKARKWAWKRLTRNWGVRRTGRFPIGFGIFQRQIFEGFYGSPEWRSLRVEALERDGARCVACGRGASDGVRLEVDHIKPKSKFPHLALVLANLQTLCYDCHRPKGVRIFDWRVHYDSHAP